MRGPGGGWWFGKAFRDRSWLLDALLAFWMECRLSGSLYVFQNFRKASLIDKFVARDKSFAFFSC